MKKQTFHMSIDIQKRAKYMSDWVALGLSFAKPFRRHGGRLCLD
jgi:hypothetical protein